MNQDRPVRFYKHVRNIGKTRQSKLICNIITKSNGRILFSGCYHVFDKYEAFGVCMTDVLIVRCVALT